MTPRYFQGNSVHGPVKASTAQTFKDVVDVFRICPTLPLTHAAFLALDKKERNEKKQVPFFVAATFKESPSKRVYAQALVCNLIFLDIDEDKDGKCPAAPFVNNPDTLYTALEGFNFVAHTTASSTPEKPRMRIVVEADGIPVTSYPRAVATIGALLGLTKLTTESKVAVQPMFLPTQFSDSGEEAHPVIAHRTDSHAFEKEDISDSIPEYETKPAQTGDASIDTLAFLRAPVPEITLAIAKEALSHVDPDSGYFTWLEIAAALKHQFSPNKSEEAYELFDEWSAGGGKYSGEDGTRAKWDSLRPTPIGRTPVTIRSLLHHAKASGWDDKPVKESCFNKLVEWIDNTETFTDLLDNGVQKILATPLLSAMQEDMLVNQICQRAWKRFVFKVSANAIRKDMAKLKAQMKAQERSTEKPQTPKWAGGVCYISAAQEFYRQRTREKYKPESFNATYSRWLLPNEDALKEAGIPVTPATLSRPIVSPSDYALNHLKIPAVYDYAYDPSQPTEMFFVSRGRKFVNTYAATYPDLDEENAEEAGASLLRHLGHLIAEPSYRTHIVDFMAYMVQCPGEKIRHAIMMQSAEGAGKTYISKVMQGVLGFEHVKILGDGAIKSGYSEWAFGHQLVVVEEIYASGPNRQAIMNTIKPLITNDDISIDEKFQNNRQVENIANYILFSNHHDALALTPNDRRYFVVKSPLQSKEQVLALGDNYFAQLFRFLKKHPGAFRAFLMGHKISASFKPDGHAPRTKYVTEMVSDSASSLTAAVRRLLLEADYPLVQYDIVSTKTLMDAIAMEDGLKQTTAQQLAQTLREEGFRNIGRHAFKEERHYLWVRNGVDEGGVVKTAGDRLKGNVKNLCMDLIYS